MKQSTIAALIVGAALVICAFILRPPYDFVIMTSGQEQYLWRVNHLTGDCERQDSTFNFRAFNNQK